MHLNKMFYDNSYMRGSTAHTCTQFHMLMRFTPLQERAGELMRKASFQFLQINRVLTMCVCTRMYVRACVHAQVSLRGAIRVGWVNGDVCGFQRNLRLCLAASLCAYVDATERERQI